MSDHGRAGGRRRIVIGAGIAAAVLALGLAVLLRGGDGDPDRGGPVDEQAGRRSAQQACSAFEAFLRIAERNGAADDAVAALDRMVAAGDEAARRDPVWTQLASGAQTLRLGFDEDDARTTRLGLDLVRAECAGAGA